MAKDRLRVGRIDYLNVWPVFEGIRNDPVINNIELICGHPSLLNRGLARGTIDLAPSSSFEYLVRAERYSLLPGLGISACNGVRSVLLCLPFPFDELEKYALNGGNIRLTSASAASIALLQVLWKFYWKLPPPVWKSVHPGQPLDCKEPFLEIGDHALSIYLHAGSGLWLVDLASEWKKFTGLPFVFALWILNREMDQNKLGIVEELGSSLTRATRNLHGNTGKLSGCYPEKKFQPEMIKEYWKNMDYGLGPDHLAGLAVFGKYLTMLEMIDGMPVLDFI